MKKMIKLQATTLSLMLLLGCEQKQQHTDKQDNNSNQTTITAAKESEKEAKSDIIVNKKEHLKESSINNSGSKLSFSGQQLLKGDIVFNHAIQQKGVVTGGIFITINVLQLPQALTEQFKWQKVTNHNYQHLVAPNVDLIAIITQLKNYDEVTHVELQVDYSPIDSQF
ncbi:hypothetical protein [Pseudoalteromonas mariniglutinosa]|uniref:hypothetical protein n=1 Tax=Pseudoalteromonas mariniglutinosa TaxID=206042 RepID=UPI00384CD55A